MGCGEGARGRDQQGAEVTRSQMTVRAVVAVYRARVDTSLVSAPAPAHSVTRCWKLTASSVPSLLQSPPVAGSCLKVRQATQAQLEPSCHTLADLSPPTVS